jgi:hypothetical protein
MIGRSRPFENAADLVFLLGDSRVHVSKFLFAGCCSLIRDNRDFFNLREFRVEKPYPLAAFQAFCDLCQGKGVPLTAEIIPELFRLSTDFGAPVMGEKVKNFVDLCTPAQLVDILQTTLQLGADPDFLEAEIARRFDSVLNCPDLLGVPLESLMRIVLRKDCHIDNVEELIRFVLEYPEREGEQPGQLLVGRPLPPGCYASLRALLDKGRVLERVSGAHVFALVRELLQRAEKAEEDVGRSRERFQRLQAEGSGPAQHFDDFLAPELEDLSAIEKTVADARDELATHRTVIRQLQAEFQSVHDRQARLNASADDFVQKYGSEMQSLNERFARIRQELAPLNGVFADMARASGGRNPVAAGRIAKVGLPGEADADFPNLFDYSPENLDKTYYHRRDIPRGSPNGFEFRLVSDLVTVRGFSIRTNGFGIDTLALPKKFEISGSNDGQAWQRIATVEDDNQDYDQFVKAGQVVTFRCRTSFGPFEFIKYNQSDSVYPYEDRFGIVALSAFELFGELHPK